MYVDFRKLLAIVLIHKCFGNAVDLLRNNGNIPRNFREAPRCGVANDLFGPVRYSLPGSHELLQKWDKPQITWRFDHEYGRYYRQSSDVTRVLEKAFSIWSEVTVLSFREVYHKSPADIIISFEQPFHTKDSSPMNGSALAHAFLPYKDDELAGDIHFREDLNWNFDVSNEEDPPKGQQNFFAVALHEIGHSIGLNHIKDRNSIMYYSYISPSVLSEGDIERIQKLYGRPRGFDRKVLTKRPKTGSSTTETPRILKGPPKCDTNYDAIGRIRGELFIFKGQYMFRPTFNSVAIQTRAMWRELPENFTKIDAIYEENEQRIWFFIGREIYIFNELKLVKKSSLRELGISNEFQKLDAIFRWHHNKETFIFIDGLYWKLSRNVVGRNYPKKITESWRGVDKFDGVFSDLKEQKLFFFDDKVFYEFGTKEMKLDRKRHKISSQYFMKCPNQEEILNENSEKGDDLRVATESTTVTPIESFFHNRMLPYTIVISFAVVILFSVFCFLVYFRNS